MSVYYVAVTDTVISFWRYGILPSILYRSVLAGFFRKPFSSVRLVVQYWSWCKVGLNSRGNVLFKKKSCFERFNVFLINSSSISFLQSCQTIGLFVGMNHCLFCSHSSVHTGVKVSATGLRNASESNSYLSCAVYMKSVSQHILTLLKGHQVIRSFCSSSLVTGQWPFTAVLLMFGLYCPLIRCSFYTIAVMLFVLLFNLLVVSMKLA